MSDFKSYYFEFENIVRRVLNDIGYNTNPNSEQINISSDRINQIDIIAHAPDGSIIPVEVKLGHRATLARLRDDSALTSRLQQFASRTRPLLVYLAEIEPTRREWAEAEFRIDIWDRTTLLAKAGRETRAELEAFITRYEQDRAAKLAPSFPNQQVSAAIVPEPEPPAEPPPAQMGSYLKLKLSRIQFGKKSSKEYEQVCKDIIEYLFGNDLRDVRSQKRTTDGINVYDLIYRVRPKHLFWSTLTRDFRARVVLFECKNYGAPIGAAQVFTTERYLSASALRPICFVLTRKPAHRHAVQAASGAMRETGKLLVFLSDIDVAKMLDAKDAQLKEGGSPQELEENDPTEVLDQAVYDFIAGLPR